MPADLLGGACVAAGAVLGASGVTIAGIEITRRRSLRASVLARKWATWTVLAAMWLLTMTSAWALPAVLAVVAAIGGREYARLASLQGVDSFLTTGVPVAGLVLVTAGADTAAVLGLMLVSVTLPPILRQDLAGGCERTGRVLLGLVVAGLAPLGLLRLGLTDPAVFVAVLFGVALSDVTAFTIGTLAGGRHLAPDLSPAKTWAGVSGNLLGALAGVALTSAFAPIGWPDGIVIAVVIAIGSVWGDLLESLVKRTAGVKDAGRVLPGFGGILDRVDSLIVSVPLVVMVTTLLGRT